MMLQCEFCGGALNSKRQFCDPVCRKRNEFKACGTTKALTKVAAIFQRMIRAEYAARPAGSVTAVDKTGSLACIKRDVGMCVCVTCGVTRRWDSGIRFMHTGHFVASRRASIVLDERNVAPQCYSCNVHGQGRTVEFHKWMLAERGQDVIDDLLRLRNEAIAYDREQLVQMWFIFKQRLDVAQQRMVTNADDVRCGGSNFNEK